MKLMDHWKINATHNIIDQHVNVLTIICLAGVFILKFNKWFRNIYSIIASTVYKLTECHSNMYVLFKYTMLDLTLCVLE